MMNHQQSVPVASTAATAKQMLSPLVEREQAGQRVIDLIPSRHGVVDDLILLLPPDEEHDRAMARVLSDAATMSSLEFMMRPSGYSAEDAKSRRIGRDNRQANSELLNYTIAIKKSLVPEHAVEMVADDEYLPPKRVDIDGGYIDVDEPYLVVGCCGLVNIDPFNRSSAAGIILDARFWRTGISTAAMYYSLSFGFNELKLHRIGIETTERNVGMRGWSENVLGIHVEAIRKEALYLGNGKFLDSWDYALFDYQWHGRVEAKLRSKLRMLG
ncbi:hypothetical protein GGI04_004763 [Coemansia thaxteri]|uniref:N-acetyltransferase domain-containing protein n=1 Tax=Coemansia thaxteri TaxID=2663907 RepID=A0A9W8BDZ6_9FUNG|nr:hypothetical protein GGI04_004763 [Coemansia thaxteri]KAJ2003703.1 hypothetical protein H4R26_002927 [Coemansia thaxteri]KAJ2482943.1 hypothetical protein EV174_003085 [Coemansia sp. RSA 2320]